MSSEARNRDRSINYVELNVAEIQRAVEAAGGNISVPIFAFPGGHRFHFTDPDGYELAVRSEA